jgi:hypothetical protein
VIKAYFCSKQTQASCSEAIHRKENNVPSLRIEQFDEIMQRTGLPRAGLAYDEKRPFVCGMSESFAAWAVDFHDSSAHAD